MDPAVLAHEVSEKIAFQFSRSAGAGGQNVNKVNTRVTARLRPDDLTSLEEHEREMIKRRLAGRLTSGGELVLHVQEERSQFRNREIAGARMCAMVLGALVQTRPRKATAVPRNTRLSRLESKRRRAATKHNRQRPSSSED